MTFIRLCMSRILMNNSEFRSTISITHSYETFLRMKFSYIRFHCYMHSRHIRSSFDMVFKLRKDRFIVKQPVLRISERKDK